ncbi:MAG: hypothetical protein ACPGUV_08440, partial [Polyangiales bacterium]
ACGGAHKRLALSIAPGLHCSAMPQASPQRRKATARLSPSLPWLVGALLFLPLIWPLRQLRLASMRQFLQSTGYEASYYLPPRTWLPTLALGFREAFADLIWIRALIYFGDEILHRGAVDFAYDYGRAILTLDPDFRQVYTWAATATTYRSQGAGVSEVKRSVAFLRDGVRRFPDDGQLAWQLGAALAYELAPLLHGASAKERAKLEAAEHFIAAARRGHGPPWLVLSNAAELKRLGRQAQAVQHLEEMYAAVRDPEVKTQIARQIAALRSQSHLEALKRVSQKLARAHRQNYPYAPFALGLLLGPRPLAKPQGMLRPAELHPPPDAPRKR